MLIVLRLPNIIFLFEFLRSMVFTTASVPLQGDRNLRRKDVTALLGAICSKTYPSFLTVKEDGFSTSPSLLQGELHLTPKPSPLRGKGCNRPTRCSEPLCSWGGGPSEVCARFCGLGPQGDNLLIKAPFQLPVIRSQTFFTTRIKGHIDLLKEYLSELVIPLHEAHGKSY